MPGERGSHWTKLRHQPSRAHVECIVPECKKIFRRDKINVLHYMKLVQLDNSGKPIRPGSFVFNEIENEEKKVHTTFFYENNLDPSTSKEHKKRSVEVMDPFRQMEARKKHRAEESLGSYSKLVYHCIYIPLNI